MERLSTGYRINSASDDAAGLAISTRMETQIKGLTMAVKNAHNVPVWERQRGNGRNNNHASKDEATNQSANDTNSEKDREYSQDEVNQLIREIDRISETTQFNSVNILDGSWDCKSFQIGANKVQIMNVSIGNMSTQD